jgi:hypothetical protein
MYIHFAFGDLGRNHKIEEQACQVIDLILRKRCLKAAKCKEFIPSFNVKGAIEIPPESFRSMQGGIAEAPIDLDNIGDLPNAQPVSYSHADVEMVCFINISFNKLKTSHHNVHYGKFGLAFTDKYIKAINAKPVNYYTEKWLMSDFFIKKFCEKKSVIKTEIKKQFLEEILFYNKPATLYSNFLQSVIKISSHVDGTDLTIFNLTYDRYPADYDFQNENEYRVAFGYSESTPYDLPKPLDDESHFLPFREQDVFKIITPDQKSKASIENYLNNNWDQKPEVIIYPT